MMNNCITIDQNEFPDSITAANNASIIIYRRIIQAQAPPISSFSSKSVRKAAHYPVHVEREEKMILSCDRII